MHRLIVLLAFTAMLAPAALAAPTCQTREGATIRCGDPDAMPMGWTLPDDQKDRWRWAPQPVPFEQWAPGAALVIGLIALFALMPEFDGSKDSDWDEQEGDRPRPQRLRTRR